MTRKRILSIIGSPRKDSISTHLHRLFLSRFAGFADILEIQVYQSTINPCTACKYCEGRPECIFTDEMTSLYGTIELADLISVSSPIYFSSLPGPLKNLIDRCQVIWEKKNRDMHSTISGSGYFIAVAGSDYSNMFLPSVTIIRHWFNSLGLSYDEKDFFLVPSAETLTVHNLPSSITENILATAERYAFSLRNT